ncbi:hypothetical protein [Pelotalea chapellei]|uniref:Uncharacterized protein n=1 Tax=Pelotalea chapellei TaxID=44671 RepID=A0ABS5U6A5_9BACT|nr:hypothetical protein [Pelotalea chapellei]MBT1071192.1 hypothetical protein [Pelotalea chapellei]
MGGGRDIPRRKLGRTGEEVTIIGLGGEGILRILERGTWDLEPGMAQTNPQSPAPGPG